MALVVAATKAGLTKTHFADNKFLNEIAFDSDRKRMMVLYSLPEGGAIALVKGNYIYILMYSSLSFKGAPEMVLDVCTKIEAKRGVRDLNKKYMDKLERANGKMGSKGLRVLGLAYRVFSAEEVQKYTEIEDMEKELTLMSLVGKFQSLS